MANEHIPNDPYRAGDPDAPYRTKYRSDPADDHAARLDNELQIDPELAEGPAAGGRIALYAVAIAVVLGAVFYGLNNSSIKEASTSPAATPATTAQNTAPASPPTAPPGMRDVTPRANSQPGMTTGATSSTPNPAPNPKYLDPKAPPAPAPSGGTE
jgi:hypothetical protein